MSNKTAIAALTIVTASFAAGQSGAETLIVAHGFPPAHVNYSHGIEPWMACVKEATGGAIEFQHFPAGQISGHNNSVDTLNSGLAQVSGVVPGYETGKLPLNNMPALPRMGTTAVQMNAAYRTMMENGSPLAEEWASLGVRPFLSIVTPAYQILSTTEPLDTLEKLQGAKIRVSAGPQSMAASMMGATPVEISAADMYVALQRRTVDATILSLASAVAYNLNELIKSASSNGAFASGQTVFSIAEAAYQKLPPEHQKAVIDCGLKVEAEVAAYLDELNEKVKADYAAQGIQFFEFSEDVVAELDSRLSKVADEFVADLEKRGLAGQKAYDMYREALGM